MVSGRILAVHSTATDDSTAAAGVRFTSRGRPGHRRDAQDRLGDRPAACHGGRDGVPHRSQGGRPRGRGVVRTASPGRSFGEGGAGRGELSASPTTSLGGPPSSPARTQRGSRAVDGGLLLAGTSEPYITENERNVKMANERGYLPKAERADLDERLERRLEKWYANAYEDDNLFLTLARRPGLLDAVWGFVRYSYGGHSSI